MEGCRFRVGKGVVLIKDKKKSADKKTMILNSIIEGRKMEIYTEKRTSEMHQCMFCETICYRKKPIKELGKKWICIDCLRKLNEMLETLKQWEEEITLEEEMKKQLADGLSLQEL